MSDELEKNVEQAIFEYSRTHAVLTDEVRNLVKGFQREGKTYQQIIDFLLCDTE